MKYKILIVTKPDKMQSEKADYAPVPSPGRNKDVVFDSVLFPALYENMTSSAKQEVHNTAVRGRTNHGQVTCRKIGKIWTSGFYRANLLT